MQAGLRSGPSAREPRPLTRERLRFEVQRPLGLSQAPSVSPCPSPLGKRGIETLPKDWDTGLFFIWNPVFHRPSLATTTTHENHLNRKPPEEEFTSHAAELVDGLTVQNFNLRQDRRALLICVGILLAATFVF